MKFIIKNIYLWFGVDRNPSVRRLCFERNKVNVVRGDATTGKTTIFAIIDYCMLADKMNIVETVINENVEWYGLEVEIGNKSFAIARKAQTDEMPSNSVYIKEGVFEQDFYPSRADTKINDAKRTIELAFGFAVGKEPVFFHYRRNLCLCYLAESIIASDHEYIHLSFFDEYNKANEVFKDLLSEFVKSIYPDKKSKDLELNPNRSLEIFASKT